MNHMLVFVSGSANLITTQSATQGQVTLVIEGVIGYPPCNMSLMINVKSKQCSQVAVSKVNLATNQSESVSGVCGGNWSQIRWSLNPSSGSSSQGGGSSDDMRSRINLLSVQLPTNSSIDIDNATVQCSSSGNYRFSKGVLTYKNTHKHSHMHIQAQTHRYTRTTNAHTHTHTRERARTRMYVDTTARTHTAFPETLETVHNSALHHLFMVAQDSCDVTHSLTLACIRMHTHLPCPCFKKKKKKTAPSLCNQPADTLMS